MQSLNPKQQLKSIKDLFPKNLLNTEARDEMDKIKMIEQEIFRDGFIYETGNKKRIKHIIQNSQIFWKRNS